MPEPMSEETKAAHSVIVADEIRKLGDKDLVLYFYIGSMMSARSGDTTALRLLVKLKADCKARGVTFGDE